MPPQDFVKFLIDQSFRNVFSRTEEGIGMKLDIYVPINVVSKCWDLSVDRKFKMAAIGGERLYMIFMGNAFSPSSFWEPLYIIHTNLADMIMHNWCTFNDKLFRDSGHGCLRFYIDWSFKNFTRAYENQVSILCS